MKSSRNDSAPSSITIGILTVENILHQNQEPIDIKSNTEYLLTILELFDLDCLKEMMSISFQILQDPSSTKTYKDAVKSYISSVSLHFQKSYKFRSQIVLFFDSLQNLPVNLLQDFPLSSSIILTALSCHSRFNIAKLFFSTKILPKATEETFKEIDESILYDVSQLNLKNFSFDKIHLSQLYFSRIHQVVPVTDVKIEKDLNINPSLYDAVVESDSRTLTTTVQLKRLFDFFDGFDSNHAASFILAVSSQNSSFRNYFSKLEETQRGRIIDLFRESFLDRKVDLESIPFSLDLPYVKSIDLDGCSEVFTLLHGLLKNKQINGNTFVKEWKNKPLQIQFLTYISNNNIPDFVFEDCQMASLNGFEPPEIPNNCWLCVNYVKRILELSEPYRTEINNILSFAFPKFSSVVLLTYSQIYPNNTDIYHKSSIQFFTSIIQNHNSSGILQPLWSTSPEFCQELFVTYYHQYPNKLGNIIDCIQDHLNDVLNCNDINFVLDLAFQSSLRGLIDFSTFLGTLPKRFSPSAYDIALNFVKAMILDSSISSPLLLCKPLNALFQYFWGIFTSLSDETKLLVNTVYSICQSMNINLLQIPFSEKLPTISPPDIKSATVDYFTKFFSEQISVEQFVQIFHQLRGSSPTFFQSMISYLLQELKTLDSHEKDISNRLGELIGNMVHENLFNEEEVKIIFDSFVHGFSFKSKLTQLSISALEICSNKLRKQPEYVFSLLKQPLLRNYPLYEKIRKISANMSVPLNLSKPTILSLHPNLKRFEKLPAPHPRVCKLIQQIPNDPSVISSIISSTDPHIDWVALHLVSTIQDHPKLLDHVLTALLGSTQFTKIVIQAAIFESIQLITSPQFTTLEGSFARRRLSILGKLLGQLTLANNKMIPGRYLDLKQLLLFAFSQGKLLGVVPFVAEILCVASPYFNPPNPYMSGLLQVLASIGLTDLLKLSIKNDVFRVLHHFDVSPCQLHLVELVPDVRQGNFDFIAAPFALSYVLSPPDIDRAIQFDDNVFNPLATQSIIIPEPKNNGSNLNLKRDKMRTTITNATIGFLKSEGNVLAKVAASTASALILKDFAICNNIDLITETASVLIKQLSSGLTLVTAIQKLHRSICHQIQAEFQSEDAEWINECIQVNTPWISQMLQEVVHIRATKSVQKAIEAHEEMKSKQGQRYYDSVAQLHRSLPPGFSPTENGLTQEQRQIYEDLAELPLNPAEITTPETSDKSIRSSENFEKFFVQMTKLISTEIQQQVSNSQDVLVDESAFSVMMSNCPTVNPDFESFLSTIKTMMKFMVKLNHSINDRIYGTLLKRFVSSVPKTFVIKAQPYVIGWLRNSIPSITLIVSMIQNELITTQQLDQFFFNSLNKQPFNYRLFVFAIKFLDYTLVMTKTIKPADMILSLTLVVSTPLSMLEASNQQQQTSMNELKKVLDELEIPLNVLSPDSILQSMSTFDPIEEINDNKSVLDLFEKWKDLIDPDNEEVAANEIDEKKLFVLTKKCCESKKDFFSILIYKGKPFYLTKMIETLKKMNLFEANWEFIASSYVFLIEGDAMVLGFDMIPYYDSLITLINSINNDFKYICNFADLLHNLRPLKMPSFTFVWIQIATERHFVSTLLNDQKGWDKMATILADFTASLIYASDKHVREVFNMLYKSLLRFILVLDHDFPDFLVSFAPEFVSIVPSSFVQLHNIILHGTPSTLQITPFNPKHILKTPGIEEFLKMPQPSKNLVEKFKFDEVIKSTSKSKSNNNGYFEQFKKELENKSSYMLMSAFVVYATNSLLPDISAQQIMNPNFEALQLNQIICDIARSLRPDAAMLFLNAVVDMVRYPCRSTLFFMRTSLVILRTPAAKDGAIQCDELLVRIILERASTHPPYPWGFKILVKMMLSDSQLSIFEKPYIKGSEAATKFLKKIGENFSNDKSV